MNIRRSLGVMLSALLLTGINKADGQSLSATDSQLQFLQQLQTTRTLSPNQSPVVGNYYSLAHPEWPPMPTNPGLPAWQIGTDSYLLDDAGVTTEGATAMTALTAMTGSIPTPGEGGVGANGTTYTPPPDISNYAKYMAQSFSVIDTNDAAANNPALYNACLAFGNDTNTNPVLQITPLGNGTLVLKASHLLTLRPPPPPDTAPQSRMPESAPAKHTELLQTEPATPTQTNDFQERFEKRMKPEIERWCKVYAGRLPFNASDVTIDKFHSKNAGFIYTFMIGSTTFCVYDGPRGTYVFYMMTREASQQLYSIGNGATQHDISIPVTRKVITDLLKADAGFDYAKDQISINPTGKFSAMQGGVMVEAGGINPSGAYRIMTWTNLDFVLDGQGNLVSYQH